MKIIKLVCIFLLVFFIGACITTPLAPTALPTHLPLGTPPSPTLPHDTPAVSTPESTQEAVTTPSFSCIPQNTLHQEGTVVKIVDGDTIDVELEDGNIYRVRYIGMDTPERGDDFYKEASEYNDLLVGGKTVTLIKDVSETDRYDRLLRYVFVADTFVNYSLVEQGYASAATYPPDVACAETFRQAESDARTNERGLWAP